MAKFRRSHGVDKREKSSSVGKIIMLVIIAASMIYLVFTYLGKSVASSQNGSKEEDFVYNIDVSGIDYIKPEERYYLPSSTTNQIVHHKYYSLSYNEEYEIAEWVSYVLTKKSLRIPNVHRAKRFNPDLKVKSRSAIYYDYRGSGYSRGHLAPAGDMAFNEEAMKESFLMGNITPQKRAFNGGIWNELEQNVRNWAWKDNKLFIATGPVINNSITNFIGKNKVGVPNKFYKVILDIDDPERKAIGFVIPNKRSERPLQEYAASIDSIEKLTGINFFKDLLSDEEENRLESNFNINKWKISKKLYKQRIQVWNKQ